VALVAVGVPDTLGGLRQDHDGRKTLSPLAGTA
jgi:hypothetical protein